MAQEKGVVTLSQMRQLAHNTAGNLSELGEVVGMLGVFYGECETEADVAEKAVISPAFEKEAGAKIIIKFTTANSADNATLNVNQTGAAPITYQGSPIGKSQLGAGKIRFFTFNGTSYELVGDLNTTHNTFSGASATANGAKGLDPQPKIGDQSKYLKGDATWEALPVMQGASDSVGGGSGIVPAPIAGEEDYFLKGNGSWAQISGGGSGGSSNYAQVTKTNVTAPKEVTLSLPKSNKFQYAPPNVLLFVPGNTNVVETACDFNNGDAEDFNFFPKYVTFDGTMKLTTAYNAEVSTPSACGNGYLSLSEEINLSEYKAVEAVAAGGGEAVGIALVSAGGGSGTWARVQENSTSILLIQGNAYGGAGNLLASNWAGLTDAEKEAVFDNADMLDTLPTALYSTHSITMNTPTTLGDGYVSVSDEIDLSDYETVVGLSASGGKSVGIALVSKGGGSGTWTRVQENSAAVIVSSGSAYDFNGNLLSNNWANLSAAEKVTVFGNATGDNPLTIANTLGAFHFEIYSEDNALPTCSIEEEKAVRTFRVAMFSTESETPACVITVLPKDQLIVPQGLISLASYADINTVTMNATTDGNAAIQYAVTPDLTNYYTYDSTNDEWVAVTATAAGVLTDGMTAAEIAAIPATAWAELTKTSEAVGFAYALSMTATSETCYVDAVTLTVNMVGTWRAAVYGTEYTYAYPNNISMVVNLLANGNWKINYDAG